LWGVSRLNRFGAGTGVSTVCGSERVNANRNHASVADPFATANGTDTSADALGREQPNWIGLLSRGHRVCLTFF
jgi:hypothetical protein